MFYAGGIVFFQKLGLLWGERVRAVFSVLIALACAASLSGCGIPLCGGTAVYGVALSLCA